ncbi:MAG: hypothetical protein ACJ77K_19170 [Bacteroidia bacterium]
MSPKLESFIQFTKDYPLAFSIPIALVGAIYGIRSYKINKTRLGLDKIRIFNDFNAGFIVLKKLHKQINNLKIKKPEDVSIENLNSDIIELQNSLEILNKSEDKLTRGAYIQAHNYSECQEKIADLINSIRTYIASNNLTWEDILLIKSKYGFVYLTFSFLGPGAFPKPYKPKEIKDSLNQEVFFNYYRALVWGQSSSLLEELKINP